MRVMNVGLIAVVWVCSLVLVDSECFTASELTALGISPIENRRTPAPLKLERDQWGGHFVTTAIALILLEEAMGYDIDLVDISASYAYERVADGTSDINFEVWPDSEGIEYYRQWITDRGLARDAGNLGVIGQTGWYIPTYASDKYSGLYIDFWRAFTNPDVVDLFPKAGTTDDSLMIGSSRQFIPEWCVQSGYPSDCTMRQYQNRECDLVAPLNSNCMEMFALDAFYDPGILQEQIRNNQLNISVPMLSETNFYSVVQQYLDAKEPVLFYYWVPTTFVAVNNFTRVSLKQTTDECYAGHNTSWEGVGSVDCDFPAQSVIKIYATRLEDHDSYSDALRMMGHFSLRTSDQEALLARLAAPFEDWAESSSSLACGWLKANPNRWASWIQNTPPPFTLSEGDVIEMTTNPSLVVWAFALSIVGSWLSLILLEQSLSGTKVDRKGQWAWVGLAAIALAVGAIWAPLIVGFSSLHLGSVDLLWKPSRVFPSLLLGCVGCLCAFFVMTKLKIKRMKVYQQASANDVEAAQVPIDSHGAALCAKIGLNEILRASLAGLLVTITIISVQELVWSGLEAEIRSRRDYGIALAGAIVCDILSTAAVMVFFHLRHASRVIGAGVMAGGVTALHMLSLSAMTFKYHDHINPRDESALEPVTIRLVATLCAAVSALLLMGLNISRLKLSRNHLDRMVVMVVRKLMKTKKDLAVSTAKARELEIWLDLINRCRPERLNHIAVATLLRSAKHTQAVDDSDDALASFLSTDHSSAAGASGGGATSPSHRNRNTVVSIDSPQHATSPLQRLESKLMSRAPPSLKKEKSVRRPSGHDAPVDGTGCMTVQISDILAHPVLVELLKDRMAKTFTSENILFLLDAAAYKRLENREERKAYGECIHRQYLAVSAPTRLNLVDHLMRKMNKRVAADEFPVDLFNEAVAEVTKLVQSNDMPALLADPDHMAICQQLLKLRTLLRCGTVHNENGEMSSIHVVKNDQSGEGADINNLVSIPDETHSGGAVIAANGLTDLIDQTTTTTAAVSPVAAIGSGSVLSGSASTPVLASPAP